MNGRSQEVGVKHKFFGSTSIRRALAVMGRLVSSCACVFALVALPVDGCSDETTGTGGTGGDGGSGGMGGAGGVDLCEGVECDDFNDCTTEMCNSANGECTTPTPVTDGTECAGGTCQSGGCELTGTVLPCTEQGIRNAIAAGGGPYTFSCDGTMPVVTQAEIVIDNDVMLDGEGNLTVDGDEDHRVFSVTDGVTVELHGLTATRGATPPIGRGVDSTGGGISNAGTLTLRNSTVSENTAGSSGGGIFNQGIMTLTDSTVLGNTAGAAGGISNPGTLTLTNSTVSGNIADAMIGGDIENAGTLTLRNSTVSGNSGGAISNSSGTATLTNSTVSGNSGGLGSILNMGTLTLTNSTVSGNTPGVDGGSIVNVGTLTVTNSTVSGNTGTGIAGSATLLNSTVSGNTGTGIVGSATLLNSTVSGNTEGAIWFGSGTTTLTNSTVAGSILIQVFEGRDPASASMVATATLIVGECLLEGDGVVTLTSDGYNIESPGDTCGFDQESDQVDVTEGELNLGPLQDNGGPTMTRALLPGSVAIDVIPADMCEVDTDQRGEPRPDGAMCDVGAFEVQEGSL